MPIFFILFTGTVIAIQIMMRKNKVDLKRTIEEITEKEIKANLTRRREIEKEFFITPNKDILPIREYDNIPENKKIIKAQNTVIKKSTLTMIKFDNQISNTDLKLKYGFANLDTITMYEEHYNSYIQALASWAELLYERNNIIDAEIILSEAVNLKCDLSKVYILLIDIYIKTNNTEKLQNLIKTVENSNIYLKSKITNYYNNKLASKKMPFNR